VALESKFLNRQKGGSKEKALIENINKDLKVIVESFGTNFWANQEGSDSKVSKSKKIILNEFSLVTKRNKNIRSSIKDQKIKDQKSSGKGKKKANIVTAGAAFKDKTAVKTPAFEKNNRRSMFSIMAMINRKLPETIEKNMRSPGLENRTGRFANSVKLTDVSQTKRGFPSFGYTYDKDPYQVFEVGRGKSPWATTSRDPRRLLIALLEK